MVSFIVWTNGIFNLICKLVCFFCQIVDGKKQKSKQLLLSFLQINVPKTCNKIVVVKSDNIGRNNVVNIISMY